MLLSVRRHLEDVRQLVSPCKSVAGFSKRSGLFKQLSKTLKQAVDVRWYSKYIMLTSLSECKEELIEHAKTRPTLSDHVERINWNLLEELLVVLKSLFVWRSRLCDESKPSFHLIALCEADLKQTLKLAWKDHPSVRALKEYLLRYVKDDMSACDLNFMATMLVPQYRQL
ncbi:hypothetical protein HDE_05698 [Halotydeus destructor]|nr:hypothetical protein HDE_05698 [Halotydeus destructor]